MEFSACLMLPLTYDLNDFKSRVNRHFVPLGSFETGFLFAFNLFLLLFLLNLYLVVAVQPFNE